jgi:hypothetical protein
VQWLLQFEDAPLTLKNDSLKLTHTAMTVCKIIPCFLCRDAMLLR